MLPEARTWKATHRGRIKPSEVARARVNEEIEFLGHGTRCVDCRPTDGLDGWSRGVRRVQAEGDKGLVSFIHERLTGLGATLAVRLDLAYEAFRSEHSDAWVPMGLGTLRCHSLSLAVHLRTGACSQSTLPRTNLMLHRTKCWTAWLPMACIIPCMADVELGLRRADAASRIALMYTPGAELPSQFSDSNPRSMKPN